MTAGSDREAVSLVFSAAYIYEDGLRQTAVWPNGVLRLGMSVKLPVALPEARLDNPRGGGCDAADF